MTNKSKQISFKDTFSECQNLFIDNSNSFFNLLQQHIDLNDFISHEFYSAFDDFNFSKVLIPLNPRNESSLEKVGYNQYGYPTCPKDNL